MKIQVLDLKCVECKDLLIYVKNESEERLKKKDFLQEN